MSDDNLDVLFSDLIDSGCVAKLNLYAQLTKRMSGDHLLWEAWSKMDKTDKLIILRANGMLDSDVA